jgi:hypothetical protein
MSTELNNTDIEHSVITDTTTGCHSQWSCDIHLLFQTCFKNSGDNKSGTKGIDSKGQNWQDLLWGPSSEECKEARGLGVTPMLWYMLAT